MSHTHRGKTRTEARRVRRQLPIEHLQPLEGRALMAPVVSSGFRVATFTAAATPTNDNLGSVTITNTVGTAPQPLTSVAQLTSNNAFGGDIVRIEAGPGGDFGKGLYAISRGAGANLDPATRAPGIVTPINRPGTIYRIDPATGRTSVFFDLNTVQNQITDGGNAANGSSPGTGLVNWYDLAFDPEGIFDGKPSLFVSTLSQTDSTKNAVYRIGPDGSFLGIYIRFDAGGSSANFVRQPAALLVPPVEQQNFLRGLFVGNGNNSGSLNDTPTFAALFFDANAFRPGQNLSGTALPPGVNVTDLTFGPQVGLTSANSSYASPVYSVFTNFGTPGGGGIDAQPGLSGVQGLQGELLINGQIVPFPVPANLVAAVTVQATDTTPSGVDAAAAIGTPFRRFQDVAFDQYGYFSYSLGTAATLPAYQGSVFVSDLGTGLAVAVTPIAPAPNNVPIAVPIQGPAGVISVIQNPDGSFSPVITNGNTTGGSNIGGRIVRINPAGVVTNFAENFRTNGSQDATSFLQSSLSITFSADGTTLWASDDEGIWQFKTVTSLASSTTGSLVGLNDLRTLGVPYEGQDSAVAIIDTGVDAFTPNFRGRVATGFDVLTNGPGNDDTAAAGNGHGTIVAGVIAQFVPQATLSPVNVFTPNQVVPVPGGAVTGNATTPQNVYLGLDFVADNPFVRDPVRPNKFDRVIAANIGFGTTNSFQTEVTAFREFPQVTAAFKNQLRRFRKLGITPIGAAGQYGTPSGNPTVAQVQGDVNGIAFPAVLNEVVSVTGSFPFPYAGNARTTPNDPGLGVVPRPPGPLLLFGTGGTTIGNTLTAGTAAATFAANDVLIFKDKLSVASNRGLTTDYTAPALDVPSWSRTVNGTIGGTVAGSVGGTGGNATFGFNNFSEAGTSLSSAIVTGSFAVVASALDYWGDIAANNGVTVDGYLTTPIGAQQLNFGRGGIIDLSAYANTDAINSILQWTAVPAVDAPNTLDTINPPTLFRSEQFRNYARIDVGNAVAAIEGSIALNYLFATGAFDFIDANKNGLVTAQEIQNFVDNSHNVGMDEAGAMARLLGGTARIPVTGSQPTSALETPDQPDVLFRRFNFFEFAADGVQTGAVSIDQLRLLARNLLPAPDSFVVVDRQRASVNGFLLQPKGNRNISDLKHTLPTFAFVPKRQVARFRNISPAKFGVGRGELPSSVSPLFTLFSDGKARTVSKAGARLVVKSSEPADAPASRPTPKPAATPTKPAATPTVAPTTTPTISPVTTNPAATATGNTYFDLLAGLSKSTAPKPNYTTILSQPRQVGTPASTAAAGTTETAAASTSTNATSQEPGQAADSAAKAKAQKAKAKARARVQAEDDSFNFWQPWKSVKKMFDN